jgi:hypothetical protein
LDPWALAAPSSGFINSDGNHRDVDTFAISPSYNVSPNQALAGTLEATATRDQHVPIWSPSLSPSNLGFQQQAVSTPNNGLNNEWNLDVSFAYPAWDPASQDFAQSLSHVTQNFGQSFIPTLNSADNLSNAVADGQLDPTLQLSDFGVNNDFSVIPNNFANPTSFTQWDDLTAVGLQETMASFNQLPLPTTTDIPAAPALPTSVTNMFTAPTMPLPIARGVVSRRSNGNNNTHTCNFTGCGKVFARLGDLARHSKHHGVPQHPCLIDGCNRHGPEAFYRADKLRDHQRRKHKMAI